MRNRQFKPFRHRTVAGLRRGTAGCAALVAVALLGPGLGAQPPPPAVTWRSIAGTDAGTILGRDVVDTAGADVGPLVDVLVDKDGNPLAGVIDVGGFLGVGKRRVAVAWRLLRFVSESGAIHIQMALTFDSAAAAPEYLGSDNALIVIDRLPP